MSLYLYFKVSRLEDIIPSPIWDCEFEEVARVQISSKPNLNVIQSIYDSIWGYKQQLLCYKNVKWVPLYEPILIEDFIHKHPFFFKEKREWFGLDFDLGRFLSNLPIKTAKSLYSVLEQICSKTGLTLI